MTAMVDHKTLRVAATILFAGVLLSLLVTALHPGPPANDHAVAFAAYASSTHWTAIHLGQFVGVTLIVAGLLGLYAALELPSGRSRWAGQCGAVAAVVALGLYAVLQAVDGVALKHAVDAWARAPDAEKAARFESAEAIRWLEWGVRSYHSFMLGLAFVSFAASIGTAAPIPKPVAFLMALSGIAYLVQGWVLGVEGFSRTNSVAIIIGDVFVLAWILWLSVIAWQHD